MRRVRESNIFSFFIAATLVLVVLFFFATQRLPIVGEVINRIQSSTFSFITRARQSIISFDEAQRMRDENERLRSELISAQRDNALLAARAEDYDALAKTARLVESSDYELITGRILARNMQRPNTVTIGVGLEHGVTIGAAVIAEGGVLIGKVIEVKPVTATILLLTDPSMKVAAGIPHTTRSVGIAQGEYGLSVTLTLVPQTTPLSVGDLVITSGLQDDIPRSLIIGTVNRISEESNELFKSATLSAPIRYDELTIVSVIKNSSR